MFDCIVAKSTNFVCEEHDEPGQCTDECAWLTDTMTGGYWSDEGYDPTGCRYVPRPPEPLTVLRTDERGRPGVFVTYFSEPVL